MTLKRGGQDDDVEMTQGASSNEELAAAAQMSRAPASTSSSASDDKMGLFWRVFGGTIISVVALVAITIYNNLNSSITELRADLHRSDHELRSELSRAHEARGDLVRKDEFNARMTTSWDGLKTMQTQAAAFTASQTAATTTQRAEIEALKERALRQSTSSAEFRKEFGAALDQVKKDQAAALESFKKDVASLEAAKERLAAMALELKATRDETVVVRGQLDRNQAYDQERKEIRDRQYKLFDEAIRELQKAVGDCREKLARLEGQSGTPAKPKKPGEGPAEAPGAILPAAVR